MGAKYTKTISKAHAIDSINELLRTASNDTLASVLEDLNDGNQYSPHGLCNFQVVDHLEEEKDECPRCGCRH